MKFSFLPVLSFAILVAFAAPGSAQQMALVDAPVPIATAAPADPGASSSAMGAFMIERKPLPAEKRPHLRVVDWSLIGAGAALRALDYTSTEKALSEPQYFHEAMLPTALVENKPGFAAFEASTVAANYFAYRYLVRHRMRSLAEVSQYMYVGVMTFQVAHNYQLIGNVPAQ